METRDSIQKVLRDRKQQRWVGMVAQACNHSCLGAGYQEDHGSRADEAKHF
jgi:hypothetical protein